MGAVVSQVTPQPLQYATPVGFVSAADGPWRDGNQLITTRQMVLPDRCVKCNASAEGYKLKKTIYWQHPAYIALLLINVLVMAVVILCVRKSAKLEIGLCPKHRKKRSRAIIMVWLIDAVGLGLLAGGIVYSVYTQRQSQKNIVAIMIAVSIVLLVASIIYGLVAVRVLAPKKIDKQFGRFTGAGPEFLASLSSTH